MNTYRITTDEGDALRAEFGSAPTPAIGADVRDGYAEVGEFLRARRLGLLADFHNKYGVSV